MQEEEFVEILANHQGIIHKICHLYSKSEEERKDLFQEIVYQLWRSAPSFDPGKNIQFTTWMYRVALNTAITHLRNTHKTPETEDLTFRLENSITEEAGKEDDYIALYRAIKQLNKIDRSIILLFLDSKSYQEIAHIMGITESNVGVKLNRIKKKLKKLFNYA